jgi:hypothetical protein
MRVVSNEDGCVPNNVFELSRAQKLAKQQFSDNQFDYEIDNVSALNLSTKAIANYISVIKNLDVNTDIEISTYGIQWPVYKNAGRDAIIIKQLIAMTYIIQQRAKVPSLQL